MRTARLPRHRRLLIVGIAVPVLIAASAVPVDPDAHSMPDVPQVLADGGPNPGDKPWD